ncbi:MAG: hypothetical protein WD029_02680 [Microthrixaceae bacterium]
MRRSPRFLGGWFRVLGVVGMFACVLLATSCGDLLSSNQADAVVKIEADDQPAVLQTRQEILTSAASWGGTRVGEETTQPNQTALEFSLPGENLEIALGALGRLDARVVATEIDVEAQQIDRSQSSATSSESGETSDSASPAKPAENKVRLRVEVTQAASAGTGGFLRLIMAIFSLIGMVATAMWITNKVKGRSKPKSRPPRRRIATSTSSSFEDPPTLDPPTQETPRVPPQW